MRTSIPGLFVFWVIVSRAISPFNKSASIILLILLLGAAGAYSEVARSLRGGDSYSVDRKGYSIAVPDIHQTPNVEDVSRWADSHYFGGIDSTFFDSLTRLKPSQQVITYSFRPLLHVKNPLDYKYVYAYVWNNGEITKYLIDDQSSQGAEYELHWIIESEQIGLENYNIEPVSSISALTDETSLAIAVLFQSEPQGNTVIYEYRYRFDRVDDRVFTYYLPPESWNNTNHPSYPWLMANIEHVITVTYNEEPSMQEHE